MANPYPPNQGMPGMQPQMQQPQMQQPQMQQPPRGPSVTKSGTSRAVPVVVSAGLAVGVFCGLLFGVGIPEDANAGPSTGNNVKAAEVDTTPTPTPSSSTTTKPATPATATATKPATTTTPATGSGSATPVAAAGATTGSAGTTAGSGSAATTGTKPAAGAGSGSATPTVAATPALKKVKLIVEVKPDTVAATAKITVDKQEITGGTMELEIPGEGKKEVKVVVKASGYKTVEQKVEVEGDVTVKVELIKRSGGGGGGGGTPSRPPTGGGKKKPPGGGLIDI